MTAELPPMPPIWMPDDVADALELMAVLVRVTVLDATAQAGVPTNDLSRGMAEGVESAARMLDAAARGVRRRRGEVLS